MTARALMFQGTGSSVGKSMIVTGLARAMVRRGLRVCPFKPQNMSNNAMVTCDGGEIGRAQALQAMAAKLAPASDMNPVLLKPQSEIGSQIVVQGQVMTTASARDYQRLKPKLLPRVMESYARLRECFDFILVEGAGSAAEINLRAGDIANMGFAREAGVPVIVIGDIDRGGVIASLVGTHHVISPEDNALIAGFVVNKMRGDPALFANGMAEISMRTGWPARGLVPHFAEARRLPAEDSVALDDQNHPAGVGQGTQRRLDHPNFTIAVPRLDHIANFDDLDPFRDDPNVEVNMVFPGQPLPACDLIIIPGSKSTISDLLSLREQGWDIDILAHYRRGGKILGICGGYQMLGKRLSDPDGIEGPPCEVPGLGLLDVRTKLVGGKRLREVKGVGAENNAALSGYEMHVGETDGADCVRPFAKLAGGNDGAISADGRVVGTYVHGLFALGEQRRAWISQLGVNTDLEDYQARVDRHLDALADHLERHMDVGDLVATAS